MKQRPDGRWQKKITLPNGKAKFIYSSASTERLAVKDFNEQMLKLKQDESDSTLFEIVAEKWKEEHFEDLENNSLKAYRPGYAQAVEFFGGMFVTDIKPFDIHKYIKHLKNQGFALKTIKNRVLVVHLILKFAAFNNIIENAPCVKISTPKNLPKTKREKALAKDEKNICQNTDSLCGVLAYLFFVTGCRRGEAVALTPKDINTQDKTLTVNKTVEWVGNQPQIKPRPKTDAGVRDIPIPQKLIDLLQPYMSQKYIFELNGKLIGHTQLSRMWSRYQTEANISCTPHQLRHSYATMLFDAGIDVKTAQKWLGHADINTTLGIYTHLSENRLESSIDKLTNYFEKNNL